MNEPAESFAFGLFIRLSFWGPALLYKNQIKMGWILKYILSDTNYDGFFLIEKNKKIEVLKKITYIFEILYQKLLLFVKINKHMFGSIVAAGTS